MAGGTFKAYNKVRPGAYINFKTVVRPTSALGTRGVVALPLALGWGDLVTEVYSTDLADGTSLNKVGFTLENEESLILREALKGAYKAIVYRIDTGGVAATATLGALTATAKYAGAVGNGIAVAILAAGDLFDVVTLYQGLERHTQRVATIVELEDNEWVEFSGTGALVTNAGVTLTGGTNGTVATANYEAFLQRMKSYRWDTMGVPSDVEAVTTMVVNYIKQQREDVGKKVQAVLFNPTADYEGIISVSQGYETETEVISPVAFTAYIAGQSAGAAVDQSNTYHVIPGAVGIVYPEGVEPYGEEEIIEALKTGKLVISTRQDGAIVIEQDINTLHTFTADKGVQFSKNRVIRTLDEIANNIGGMFENNYIGKVDNTANGRDILKADIISLMNALQEIDAIQNFNSDTDITVIAGSTIDTVIAELAVQPVDSMEKLYMTVTVG